jgi:hypothetical protein
MNYTFAVITKVPECKQKNAYDTVLVKDWDEFNEEQIYTMAREEDFNNPNSYINAKLPVFFLGEILILDGSGREAAGQQRKPSKWSVEIEEFNTLDEAVSKAQEVLNEN